MPLPGRVGLSWVARLSFPRCVLLRPFKTARHGASPPPRPRAPRRPGARAHVREVRGAQDAPRHAESLKPSQRSPRALAASAGPVRPDMLKQLLMFINPSLQPKTAITSSVGIQVSSLPGGNRQISTRGLPYPLGSGAAGSRIYVHQCCGFQVSKAEGQCDVKNIGFALPSTAEPWPMVLGMEKKKSVAISWCSFGWHLWASLFRRRSEARPLQRAQSSRRGRGDFSPGLVWVCGLGPGGSGGSGRGSSFKTSCSFLELLRRSE